MSRIASRFEALRRQGKKALIPFLTAGFPNPRATVPLMQAIVAAGADVIELGVPFSDPMADGPVIQRAGECALRHNVGLEDVLAMVSEFRARDDATPVVLMGYANPIEAAGEAKFVDGARAAGVDGVIVVDYPPEECADFAQAVREAGMDLIFLLAPTTTPERIAMIAKLASGYLYYVSLTGVTGASHLDVSALGSRIAAIRTQTSLPVGVGFGIRDGATARAVCEVADAAIIGSRLIAELEGDPSDPAVRAAAFVRSVREAMDR
ncbi:MAG: tryptophan synthase subunit alpha [Betaproteobacteria bacterium]|nr:tryptophan synthase subunit alpha [Betaproteobacteria bacterium]MBI2960616.1 tryptophan synthase subunit alpha [Betaproteobacteria bacterium]